MVGEGERYIDSIGLSYVTDTDYALEVGGVLSVWSNS